MKWKIFKSGLNLCGVVEADSGDEAIQIGRKTWGEEVNGIQLMEVQDNESSEAYGG